MAFFTESFLNARRQELLQAVDSFKYQLNNTTWYQGTINSKEISGTDVVVFAAVPSSGASDVVTAVRIYDQYGNLAGSQNIHLERTSPNVAVTRFTFPLVEKT